MFPSLATETLEHRLLKENKDPENTKSKKLTINTLCFQKIQPNIRTILESSYAKICELCINDCDLRTLQNFPVLPFLVKMDVSRNSLQGTFQFVVKNRRLAYIDASHNIISDIRKFKPLFRLKKPTLVAKHNPFLDNFQGTLGQLLDFFLDINVNFHRQNTMAPKYQFNFPPQANPINDITSRKLSDPMISIINFAKSQLLRQVPNNSKNQHQRFETQQKNPFKDVKKALTPFQRILALENSVSESFQNSEDENLYSYEDGNQIDSEEEEESREKVQKNREVYDYWEGYDCGYVSEDKLNSDQFQELGI